MPTLRYVDVHCHLADKAFKHNRSEVLGRAREAGVVALVTSGLGVKEALITLKLANNVSVYASVGVAPYKLERYEEVMALAEKEKSRIKAIGEVGLDYYWGKREDRAEQQRVFREFIRLAKQLDKPLVVHSRNAGKYALEILFEEKAERVIMHAFDGSAGQAQSGAERGYYFSVPPSVTRSEQKQKMVRRLPLERLLLESDAPVLGPAKGELNEPRNVAVSAEWIARLKSVDISRVAEVTTQNATELLGITLGR